MNGVYLSLHPPPRGILFCVRIAEFFGFSGSAAIHPDPRLAAAPAGSPGAFFLAGAADREKAKQNCGGGGVCTRKGQSSSDSDPSLRLLFLVFFLVVLSSSFAHAWTGSACEWGVEETCFLALFIFPCCSFLLCYCFFRSSDLKNWWMGGRIAEVAFDMHVS